MNWDRILIASNFTAAVGSGLIAGVFFAFSTFVMKALARRPAAEGIAAMQAINVTVINPLFLGAFFGAAAACFVAGVGALLRWERPEGMLVLGGAVLYVVGTFGVTILFNVPLNDSLAALAPSEADAEQRWADYLQRWTAWNHVRTASALAAMILLIAALTR